LKRECLSRSGWKGVKNEDSEYSPPFRKFGNKSKEKNKMITQRTFLGY
jgi:hypothetical protein